jgi:hypothetical protein
MTDVGRMSVHGSQPMQQPRLTRISYVWGDAARAAARPGSERC